MTYHLSPVKYIHKLTIFLLITFASLSTSTLSSSVFAWTGLLRSLQIYSHGLLGRFTHTEVICGYGRNIQEKLEEVIEKDVRSALEVSEKTTVIILLKEQEGLREKPTELIKETVKQIQDKFLANLADGDFKLTHRNEMTPILIGELTRSGLKKVEKLLNMIRSITKPQPVKAL